VWKRGFSSKYFFPPVNPVCQLASHKWAAGNGNGKTGGCEKQAGNASLKSRKCFRGMSGFDCSRQRMANGMGTMIGGWMKKEGDGMRGNGSQPTTIIIHSHGVDPCRSLCGAEST
jgi:hypothetical protein